MKKTVELVYKEVGKPVNLAQNVPGKLAYIFDGDSLHLAAVTVLVLVTLSSSNRFKNINLFFRRKKMTKTEMSFDFY